MMIDLHTHSFFSDGELAELSARIDPRGYCFVEERHFAAPQLRRRLLAVPVLTPGLCSLWISALTPISSRIAQARSVSIPPRLSARGS